MRFTAVFAEVNCSAAAFLTARFTRALTGIEWATAGLAIRLCALFAAAATWMIHFIIHTLIISRLNQPTKKAPDGGLGLDYSATWPV